jgi:hypothetical protein
VSGGGYGYLYDSRVTLVGSTDFYHGRDEALREMLARLEGLGWTDAADATRAVIDALGAVDWQIRMLGGVWHAIEWWDDGDIGEEEARRAYAAWREQAYAPGMVPRE